MALRIAQLSRRWFAEVWNERRTATIDELLSSEGVGHMETGDLYGIEPFKQVRDEFVAAVPDLVFTIEGIVGEGDDVVVRWLATGTHSGEGLGIPHDPTTDRCPWHDLAPLQRRRHGGRMGLLEPRGVPAAPA